MLDKLVPNKCGVAGNALLLRTQYPCERLCNQRSNFNARAATSATPSVSPPISCDHKLACRMPFGIATLTMQTAAEVNAQATHLRLVVNADGAWLSTIGVARPVAEYAQSLNVRLAQ